jgi:hypothetical protein
MSSTSRGKLKEELEGIHSNLDWVRAHCAKGLAILGDTHPELQEFFKSLATMADTLDELTNGVYAKL